MGRKVIFSASSRFIKALLICLYGAYMVSAGAVIPPNWGDIRIGLVNDNNAKINVRMKQAGNRGRRLNIYLKHDFLSPDKYIATIQNAGTACCSTPWPEPSGMCAMINMRRKIVTERHIVI